MRVVENLAVGSDERGAALARLRDNHAVRRIAMERFGKFGAGEGHVGNERENPESGNQRRSFDPLPCRACEGDYFTTISVPAWEGTSAQTPVGRSPAFSGALSTDGQP